MILEKISEILSSPLVVVDIGALGEIHKRWEKIIGRYPIKVYGFKPDRLECKRLNKKSSLQSYEKR